MKKGLLFLSLLLLSNLVIVSAIDSDLREYYAQKETAIVKINGNVLEPIDLNDIEFRRGHVKVPFEYDVKKIGDYYYIWFIAPETNNTYSMSVKNIITTSSGSTVNITYEKNFTVIGNLTDYSINPGFVFAQEDFEITVDLFLDNDLVIPYDFPSNRQITLKPGENTIKFDVDEVEGTKVTLIHLGKYVVPAYVVGKKQPVNNQTTDPEKPNIAFEPGEIRRVIVVSERQSVYPVAISNKGITVVRNIEIQYNQDKFGLEPNRGFDLAPGETKYFNLTLKDSLTGNVDERIYANYGDLRVEMPIVINYSSSSVQGGNSSGKGYYCSEMSGKICSSSDVCEGTISKSIEGNCCVGKCVKPKSGGNSWIGYLIAGIVIVAALIVYFKYKGIKSKSTLKIK